MEGIVNMKLLNGSEKKVAMQTYIYGFIIGFLLLVYGSFSLFPTFSQDYNKINSYKNNKNLYNILKYYNEIKGSFGVVKKLKNFICLHFPKFYL